MQSTTYRATPLSHQSRAICVHSRSFAAIFTLCPDNGIEFQSMSTPPRPQLLRAVGLFSFTAIAVNGMVGSGIFVLPAQVSKILGPPGLSGYAMAGLAAALIVLCFAEVGALFDRSGGPYLYAPTAFAKFVGFPIGWMLLAAPLTPIAAIR